MPYKVIYKKKHSFVNSYDQIAMTKLR